MKHTQEPARNLVVRDSSGRDLQNAYPGYRCESTSSREHRFKDDQGNIIIDILGHNENQEPVILYTLFNSDASLYDLLQWEDPFRAHSDVCFVQRIKMIGLGIIFSLISLGFGLRYIPFEDKPILILASIFVAFVSSILFAILIHWCKKIWCIAKGFVHVWWYLRKNTSYLMDPLYYKQLFETLSRVGSPDKARSARIMARLLA